ncbi:hypothetical protein ACFS5M_13360 [Lacinutrix iliipiscaria]|uniref:STAS domain-containing protein n=1 Tax=Lacinutrix iliipiscaria TaxID=1230532 RepID=A0ABW5WQB6_9FLAO
MEELIQINDFKFWIEKDIIYCEIQSGFDNTKSDKYIANIFTKAISALAKGKCLSFLIDMSELSYKHSIRVFKILSNNPQAKSIILSRAFLVDTYILKGILSIISFIYNPILPDTIYINSNKAIKYCNKSSIVFNAVN